MENCRFLFAGFYCTVLRDLSILLELEVCVFLAFQIFFNSVQLMVWVGLTAMKQTLGHCTLDCVSKKIQCFSLKNYEFVVILSVM